MVEPDPVITPSAGLWAVVRHAAVPERVPDDLLAFVTPIYDEETLVDWALTEDVVAFGDVDVPTAYQRWRATWERTWPLDSHSSLTRLTAVARSLAGELDLAAGILELASDDAWENRTIEDPDELRRLADDLELVRDAIRGRESTGYGLVDATEGRDRVGLALAWSPSGDAEILAADQHLTVTMRPAAGLCLDVGGDAPWSISGVVEVALAGSAVEVRNNDRAETLDPDQAIALSWVLPGAARWRVRVIPEVLVWAKTFGGLVECARYAAALQLPLAHPAVACVIPGAATPEQVEQNAELIAQTLPNALWRELAEEGLIPADAPTP